ncbi:MAG TPA: IclR family transcriptional regulator [Geminicoccaceae bacterium]|nr:IclR family transcriptional regulator [Geminicoccaceae bacterium]
MNENRGPAPPAAAGGRGRYSAPALEKGLDILELLAGTAEGLSATEIARRLGRSVSEIFRMLVALEARGWVRRREADGSYALTLRLFELAHRHPPIERLLGLALAEMRDLAARTGQSCHLAVYEDGRILIVARVESPLPRGFVVRLAATFDLLDTASGRVLAAFQPAEERARRLARALQLAGGVAPPELLSARLDGIVARGHEVSPSTAIRGITDLSFPVRDHTGAAVAALTIPFAEIVGAPLDAVGTAAALGEAAFRISSGLGFGEA